MVSSSGIVMAGVEETDSTSIAVNLFLVPISAAAFVGGKSFGNANNAHCKKGN